MGRIFVLMGKSASGKDTLYQKLLKDRGCNLVPYVIHTTRPMRDNEADGREYHFSGEREMEAYRKSGKLIESRVYHTVYGDWYYFTVDTENIDLDSHDYIYIGTLDSYVQMRNYFGTEKVVPLFIELDDGERLLRALVRERKREKPAYAEMCRRFISDAEDFSEEKIRACGIEKRFDNGNTEECLKEILKEIKKS